LSQRLNNKKTATLAVFLLHVPGKEAGNHTADNQDGDKNPDPFDNFFGVFVVEKTHR
jgi:hypothetical protein